jgi:anti-sigma regulatory factor (Ser/Thr protein kinase)
MSTDGQKVAKFILEKVEEHPSDLTFIVASHFNISRQMANSYIAREVKNERLIKIGQTRSTRYFLAGGKHIEFKSKIEPGLGEDKIWSKYGKPMILKYPENIRKICNYGFTEIFNNAIDHSGGNIIYTTIDINDNNLDITITDNGVGIYQKIKKALNLDSEREAILHLSKGKFTTDPSKHSGEGIFFTSRIFDSFSILSEDMFYTFENRDWFLSNEKRERFGKGTNIRMNLSLNTKRTVQEIFSYYTDKEIGFGKTVVAVALSSDPDDPHVSRSQAKRLLLGLEKFKTVVLDFKGVESVGQAFVDEIFRVFKNEYPNISIQPFNTNKEVEEMIERGSHSN